MFSWRKARIPPKNVMMNSARIRTRCLSANAISAFMTGGFASCSDQALAARCGAIDEQAALGDHLLADLETIPHLDHAAADETGLDRPQFDRAILANDPDARGVAFVEH